MSRYLSGQHLPLTARQIEVLGLVADGMTNEEIARHLFITTESVARHLRELRAKLRAPNRAAAVDRGWRLGYLGGSNVRSKGRMIG